MLMCAVHLVLLNVLYFLKSVECLCVVILCSGCCAFCLICEHVVGCVLGVVVFVS